MRGVGSLSARSEGLAIASLRLFESGVFSQRGSDDPLRVDASSLQALTPKILASEFQVSPSNPLFGLEDRAKLLNRLGETLKKQKNIFEAEGTFRPGKPLRSFVTKTTQRRFGSSGNSHRNPPGDG
jgi:hypothetical protein